MTLDVTLFRESKAFIDPHRKSVYPVKITVQHYQLRHFISTVDDDIVYYAAFHEVFAIHTPTGRRERIAALDFVIQCLGAAFGWICVGGHHGKCAFIDISGTGLFAHLSTRLPASAEVDALLPLNLDPTPRIADELPEPHPLQNSAQPIRVKVYHRDIGGDIVNSITLHRLQSKQKGTQDEEVAVISGNDHTVQIFSLRQLQVLKVMNFSVNMNHASMSPDGTLIVACGDDSTAYFCQRKVVPDSVLDSERVFVKYDWELLTTVALTSTVRSDTCFSTAFSPSGHICTVSSQYGTVTVFDTSLIRADMEDDEAVIDTFTSSRPAVVPEEMAAWMPGAVRSSAFSPEPWDLFAWAEDRGRVCIADLRDGFRSRQMIELDPRDPGIECIEVIDMGAASDVEQMLERSTEDPLTEYYRQHGPVLRGESDLIGTPQAADYVEGAVERRRRLRNMQDISIDFTDTERQILETLRAERLQEATNAARHDLQGQSTPSSLRDYIRERNTDRVAHSRTHYPRRRSSVVIDNSNAGAASSSRLTPLTNATNFSTSPSRLPSTAMTPATAEASAPRIAPFSDEVDASVLTLTYAERDDRSYANYLAPASDPWQTISNAMSTATSASPQAESAYASDQPFQGRLPYFHSGADEDQRSIFRDIQARNQAIREERLNLTRRISRQRAIEEERDHARGLLAAARNSALTPVSNTPPQLPGPPSNTNYHSPPASSATAGPTSGTATGSPAAAAAASQRRRRDRERDFRWNSDENAVALRALAASGIASRGPPISTEIPGQAGTNRIDRARLSQLRALRERSTWLMNSGNRNVRLTGRLADEDDVAPPPGSGEGLAAAQVTLNDATAAVAEAAELRYAQSLNVGTNRAREHGIAIQGLGWSRDGRSLFVGSDEGIFQYRLNLAARKTFPATKLF